MANAMRGGFLRDADGALVISGGSSGAGVGAVAPSELKRKMWLPTGMLDPSSAAAGDAIDESSPRLNGAQTTTLVSGTAFAVGNMVVPAGRTVDSITFETAGSGASGITGYFFALVKQDDLTVLARSADATAAWAGNTARTLKMTTPWTATQDTRVYAVICMVASSMPSLSGYASHIQSINRAPVFCGTTNSGLTNAASLPSPINAPVQASAGMPYASINSLTSTPAADVSEGLDTTVVLGSIAATKTAIVKPVQFPITVQGISLVLDNTAIASSDTDYWTAEVGKLAALTGVFGSIMATKTTKTTGGAPFLTNQAWTFDAVTFTAANQTLVKDDVLAIKFTKTGAPSTLQGLVASARYQIA
ncbi:MAG TPA: hypothetical protein VIR33_04395 [Thermopolyspora sp.]|jgi:hypothetical protein